MVALNDLSFEYRTAKIGDLRVETKQDQSGHSAVRSIFVNDEPIKPTERFWTSLYARFGFNKSFFKYFKYEEVFERISDVESNQQMRICIERNSGDRGNRLLAVSNPTKPVVRHDELIATLSRYDGEQVSYSDGIVQSNHSPRVGGNAFDISGDRFSNQFVMNSPIDGYGQPNIYLSLLRQICSNGMIGYARAFRSSLSLGTGDDNPQFAITRALDGFGNDEGYAALRQRFESATKSWASVYETNSIYKKLLGLIVRNQISGYGKAEYKSESGHPVLEAFHQMTGEVSTLYGIANVDSLSTKRQRTLPVNCTVYDLLNFVSELATHHTNNQGSRVLQAAIGTLISTEYDLEGSLDSFGEFKDFFVSRRINGEVAMDLQAVSN